MKMLLWIGLLLICLSSGAKTLYVDGKLSENCKGNYSIAKRARSGKDGDAYKTISAAAKAASAGDTVLIRAGTYNCANSVEENDVLWAKNSGAPGKPIVFKAYSGEKVVLGEGSPEYPDSDQVQLSIARCVVTLKDVSHICIEDLQFSKVAGWVFARTCHHIEFRNCTFKRALHGAKGCARLLECQDCRFMDCSFRDSSFDSLALEKCERTLVQGCTFASAAHALLAIRSSSHSVIRHCQFRNPYFRKNRAEKLIEVYDVKLDRRKADNPVYMAMPAYNSTKHNLFEYNFFGYHPFRPGAAAQPSAMQYSGQAGIIRRNVFANPPLKKPDPDYPEGVEGGMAINMRWGGSWSGWRVNKGGAGHWLGEALESGYVTHNRFYNNVLCGYDHGCVAIPAEDAMDKVLNPPPLYEANPSKQYGEKFAFRDNLFMNNILTPGQYQSHFKWTWQQRLTGTPVAVVMMGSHKDVLFQNNDFFPLDEKGDALIYISAKTGKNRSGSLTSPSHFQTGNLQQAPRFVNTDANDFQLKDESPLIDAGSFLTEASGAASASKEMAVKDTGFFYDGFGIEGEEGDLIQLKGQKETARIVHIDYVKRSLTLDRPLTWQDGQGVSLAYSGNGPDIGAFEKGQPMTIGPEKVVSVTQR